MFQGLKSRLAEETRKLQNAVNQVGITLPEKFGNLSQGAPSVGSLQDKQAGRSNDVPGNEGLRSSSSKVEHGGQNLVDISLDTNPESHREDSSSSITATLPVRQRHDSGSSISSYDSIFMQSHISIPGNILLSDLESIADEDSVSVCSTQLSESSSLEKVSLMLDKLSSQASLYRDKYKKALGAYRSCLAENERLKATIDVTRDRAVERIRQLRQRRINETEDFQKIINELNAKVVAVERAGNEEAEKHKQKVKVLEDLLGRCKESITNYKSSIEQLTLENNALREKADRLNNGIDNEKANPPEPTDVDQRWREELKRVEEESQKKLQEMEEQHNMNLAKIKQDMHEAIETKDAELESFHQRLNLALDELQSAKLLIKESKACEETLENEKKELVSQLAAVKQAVVKAIVEEESKKHEAMIADYEERIRQMMNQMDSKAEEAKADYERMYQSKRAELEQGLWEERQQMMLEVEEREMQKSAALLAKDEMIAELNVELEKLRTNTAELESRLDNYSKLGIQWEELERRSIQHSEALLAKDETISHQQQQIDQLKASASSLEDKLATMVAVEKERGVLEENLNNQRLVADNLSKTNADLESRLELRTKSLEDLQKEFQESQQRSSQILSAKEEEVNMLTIEVSSLQTLLSTLESEQEALRVELSKATEERNEAMTKAEMLENKCNELTACKEGMEEKSERLISEALQAANEQAQKELQSTIDDMSQRNLSKMAELRDMAQKWKSEATSLQDRLNNQDAELDEYNRAMEQWANERSTIDQQMKHLQEELEDEKKKAASFEEQLKKAESDRVHIASELTNASKEVECLRLEKNTLCLEHEQLMEKSKATFEALQKANGYIESLEAMDQSERNVTAAFTLLANLSQGYLSLLDKTATCIPDMEELVTDKSDISVDKHAAESVDSSHGLEDSLEKCRLQLTRFADLLARGDKPLDDLVNESALVSEVVTVVMESIDRLIKTCRLRSEAIKELRDSTNILLKEKESLKSEIDTFGPIKASCERSWSSFKASLSRLTPPTEDKLSVSPLLERDHILSRLEQVAAKCDEASVNYDFSAPFDSLVSMMQWLLETGDLRWQSHQASIGILDKKYHLLEKRFEEKINECNRLSDLRLSEEEAKVSRQKDAAAFFAEMETIFEELSSQMCQMNIPVLEASLECLGGLVLVCSQLKRLDEPLLRKEEFLNGVRLAYGSMLSSLESEATKLNKELSNSKENMRTIDILKAQLVSNDSQTQMLRVALQRLFDSVAHEFDQIQCRLCKFESAIGDSLSSLSQLDSALQQRHSLNEKLTSLRARNENLEAEVASKQKELELLRRTSVWSDWEQDELAASVHGSSPREPPDVETNAHRVPDDTHERDKVKQVEVAKVELPSLECAPLAEALNGTLSSHDVKNSLSGQDTRSELSNRDYPTHLDQFAMRSEQTGHSAQERKRFDSVDFHPLFAEPTEAEYLKNILYRYMTERELLGRESVTLAKAIAAVVKFSPSQTRLVLLKEESRSAASW